MSRSNQTARTAVFHGAGQPLEICQFELPQISKGQGLVEIDCCTLCGSDLHTIFGARNVAVPTILGHEIIGRLIEGSPGLTDIDGIPLRIGDRVSWSVAASCNDCFYCLNGLPQKCEALFKYGHSIIDDQHQLSGGLATHCHFVKGTQIVKVPDELPDWIACPANCATATVAGAFRVAEGCSGKSVLILGAGMLGLSAAAFARDQGASEVVVSDTNRKRAEYSMEFGATHTAIDEIETKKRKRGFDIAFEMSGSSEAMTFALDSLRTGGRLVLVGAVFPGPPVKIHADQIVRRMIRIEGIHNYVPADLKNAFAFLMKTQGQYPFQQLVEREYRLSQVNQAIEDAKLNKPIRIAVRPD